MGSTALYSFIGVVAIVAVSVREHQLALRENATQARLHHLEYKLRLLQDTTVTVARQESLLEEGVGNLAASLGELVEERTAGYEALASRVEDVETVQAEDRKRRLLQAEEEAASYDSDTADAIGQATVWLRADQSQVVLGEGADTNLYRSNANELCTDGDLRVGGKIVGVSKVNGVDVGRLAKKVTDLRRELADFVPACPRGMVEIAGSYCVHPETPFAKGKTWHEALVQCADQGLRLCSQAELMNAIGAGALRTYPLAAGDFWYLTGSQALVQANTDQADAPLYSIAYRKTGPNDGADEHYTSYLEHAWATTVCCTAATNVAKLLGKDAYLGTANGAAE